MHTPRNRSLRRHTCSMQGILMNLETGTMTAGADPRRTQYAVGW